jgi:hypothetical protein
VGGGSTAAGGVSVRFTRGAGGWGEGGAWDQGVVVCAVCAEADIGGEAEPLDSELILDNELQLAERLHLMVKLLPWPYDVSSPRYERERGDNESELVLHDPVPVRLRSKRGIF